MTGAAAWVLTIVLAATPAEALSRVHFQRAQKLFAQHDYRRALDEFTVASENAPTELPELYFDIAQCHRNLGHARQAVLSFQHYLALRPDAPDRVQVRAMIVQLGGRAPAEDGAPAAEPPAASGAMVASSSGSFAPSSPSGASSLALSPPPSASEPSATGKELSSTSAGQPGAPTEASPLLTATQSPPEHAHRRRWPIWVGVAAGVAVTAVAVGLGVGLSSSGNGAAPAPSSPTLGSAGTFDTRGH
ncbi:MAG: hypothetical protein JWN44_5802 [Myxococcales bacterium]|nr:hypothetical protein [Myxococcales bacterium]